MPNPVSVILPIHRWVDRTPDAIASILNQTHEGLELLLITNGDEPGLRDRAHEIARADHRVRVIHSPEPSLPKALNLGIEHAKHELTARMDADDWSHPDRFREQVVYMESHPGLAGCATATQMMNPDGHADHIHTPPSTAGQTRWRVLVWNPFVHGSMMLRKSALQAVGGYNESLDRAQDLDLWLRLSDRGLAGLSRVLYTHFMKDGSPRGGLDSLQAPHTARLLMQAWDTLTAGDPQEIQPILAQLMSGDESARTMLESHMESKGPSRAALTAWLWSCWRHPIAPTAHPDRLRKLDDARTQLKSSSCTGVWLWGAGDFAREILSQPNPFGVPILGILDDYRAGEQLDQDTIWHPENAPIEPLKNQAVFIASDLYAKAIWERSAPLRIRGVRVLAPSVDCAEEPAQ